MSAKLIRRPDGTYAVELEAGELQLKSSPGRRRKSTSRVPCECGCRCGSSRDSSAPACYLCTGGTHHRCSRACRAYAPAVHPITDRALIRRLGRRSIATGIIPRRHACDGGAR